MLSTDEVIAAALIPEQDLISNAKPKARPVDLTRF
jgi:hypothetical protein